SVDVLANDSDPDGDNLTVIATTPGNFGTVAIADNNRVVYTPNPNFRGNDSFTYTISDPNGGTDTARVNLSILNSNPIASNNSATTPSNSPVNVNVLGNDYDGDGDILSLVDFTSGENGDVSRDDNGTPKILTDDSLIYTPNTGFNGSDTFTYTVDDGNGGTDTGTVVVEVTNSPPVANDDTAETRHNPAFTITPQDLATVTIDVLANDSDPDDDILSIINVVQGENGSVEINDDNTVTYTPNLDFLGTDTFTYTVDDGNENTATATVTVEVTNSPPIANDDIIEVTSGTSTEMRFLLNDRDPDGDILVVTSATQPMNGELNLQLEDVTIFYTSNPGFIGTDSFTYTISDRLGGTDTATITINVVNFPPIIDLDESADGVNFNTVFNVGGEAIAIANNSQITDLDDTTLASVTVNFTPIDGEFETLSLSTIPPEITATPTPNGLNLTGTASLEAYQTAIDGIIYNNTAEIPTPGDRIITVTASDSKTTGEVATTTIRLNQPPIATNLETTTRADTPVSLDILTEAIDPDGDAIAISNFTNGENGTVTLSENGLIYTPNPSFGGFDTFTYTLTDSNGATASATVTVGVSNIVVTPPIPPVTAENDGSAVDVALSLPPTADVRVGIVSSDPTEAIVVPNTLIFTPENFSTPQSVIVAGISDFEIDGDSAFNLIISPADSADPNYDAIDAPDLAFTNLDTTSIIEFSTPRFTVSEENPAIAITRNNTAGVVGIRLVLSGGTATPNFDYDPIPLNVVFNEGENSKVVTLPIFDDRQIEAAETVDISLENPQANAILGTQTVANVVINPSDGGALNLNIQNLRSITSTNPQLRDRGVEFSNNALGIEDFNLNGSGNFIDEKPGRSDAITYDRGDSIDIDVPEGFVDEISFRYASPFRSHQVVIRDAFGNELASRTLSPTNDSGLTPGAYVLSDRITTIEFEGIATSVELGSQANKLLIADLMLGSSDNNLPELGFMGAIVDPFTQLF
ncbi:MAG: Ig-like domain-containing protein, partial [Limnospira sp.]